MKRSGPLRRRTPLRRSGGLKRTPLSPVSDRRKAEQRRRRAVAEEIEDEAHGPVLCQANVDGVCEGTADDLHEPLTRARGGDPADRGQVMAVCRPCHEWTHSHVAEATELGLLVPSWEADQEDAA